MMRSVLLASREEGLASKGVPPCRSVPSLDVDAAKLAHGADLTNTTIVFLISTHMLLQAALTE